MSKIVAKLNEVYVFWLKWSKFLTPTYIHNKPKYIKVEKAKVNLIILQASYIHNKPKYTSRKGKSEFGNSSGV